MAIGERTGFDGAAQHKVPAVYSDRFNVTAGGLLSNGVANNTISNGNLTAGLTASAAELKAQ